MGTVDHRRQRRVPPWVQIEALTAKIVHYRDRALDAEAKVNDLYNQIDQMGAEIETLKLRIEQYEHNDREDQLYGT